MNEVNVPKCPECAGTYTYIDGTNYVCPECSHEWSVADVANDVTGDEDAAVFIKDSNGAALTEGDFVTVIKDLKVKGSSTVVKVGTKIKCGRIDTDAKDHEIDCKVPGVGGMKLTAKFTKKV